MSSVALDQPVPDFQCPATSDQLFRLSDHKRKILVIYFYPKDSTPGCTRESQDFRDFHDQFIALNSMILGVSRDSVKSHENFRLKQELPFDLLSDQDETLCRLFDVIKEKNMYGRKVMGIVRSTFLIDDEGVLRKEWRNVKVPGHVEEVLHALKSL